MYLFNTHTSLSQQKTNKEEDECHKNRIRQSPQSLKTI